MKILLTVHQFFPDFAAGTEVLTYSVAKELINRGNEVRVLSGHPWSLCTPEKQRIEEYTYKGIHVYRYHDAPDHYAKQSSKIELDYDNHMATEFFERILDEFEPDFVHFFHLSRLGTGLITKAAERGISASMTPTDFWTICPKARMSYSNGTECSGPSADAGNCAVHLATQLLGERAEGLATFIPTILSDFFVRRTHADFLSKNHYLKETIALRKRLPTNISRLNLLKKIVVPNQILKNLLLQHGVEEKRIIQYSYGIHFNGRSTQRTPRKFGSTFRVGFIGTLSPHKGAHILIKSFKRLKNRNAVLKIYGSETDFPKYSKKLRDISNNDPRVEFCGTFPNQSIGKVLDNIDVLVVPSTWTENTPLVIYSAKAAGCPVLASDVSGIAEAIEHNVNGLLFKRGSVESLYKHLVNLTEDHTILEKISNNTEPPKTISAYVDELLSIWSS